MWLYWCNHGVRFTFSFLKGIDMFEKVKICSPEGVVQLYDHLCATLARDRADIADILSARLTHNKSVIICTLSYNSFTYPSCTVREFRIFPQALRMEELKGDWKGYSCEYRSRQNPDQEFEAFVQTLHDRREMSVCV